MELWERGTTGIIEESGGLRAFFDGSVGQEALEELPGLDKSSGRQETTSELADFSYLGWDGISVGERFYIAPPWVDTPTPESRMRLKVCSPAAFGTGRHETTQLCLMALERCVRPGDVVLDVGCGSGILSMGARLLSAGQVISCDIQDDALATTRQHGQQMVFQGSADAVESASVDVVVANISAAVLDRLAAELQRVVKPDGRLIVSGFISENPPKRFRAEEQMEQGDWLCWILRPEDIQASVEDISPSGLSHESEWWL